MSQVHPCARTTPRTRAEINASPAAATNAAFCLLVFWVGAVIAGAIQNLLAAHR